MNKTFLFGNITQEPKLFTGKATILKFKIATNEKYKIKDEWKEKTFYHQVSVWGERANYLSSILQVGQPVVVEGKNVSGKKQMIGQERLSIIMRLRQLKFIL